MQTQAIAFAARRPSRGRWSIARRCWRCWWRRRASACCTRRGAARCSCASAAVRRRACRRPRSIGCASSAFTRAPGVARGRRRDRRSAFTLDQIDARRRPGVGGARGGHVRDARAGSAVAALPAGPARPLARTPSGVRGGRGPRARPIDELALTFAPSGRLISVDAFTPRLPPGGAAASFESATARLQAQLGPPADEIGDSAAAALDARAAGDRARSLSLRRLRRDRLGEQPVVGGRRARAVPVGRLTRE